MACSCWQVGGQAGKQVGGTARFWMLMAMQRRTWVCFLCPEPLVCSSPACDTLSIGGHTSKCSQPFVLVAQCLLTPSPVCMHRDRQSPLPGFASHLPACAPPPPPPPHGPCPTPPPPCRSRPPRTTPPALWCTPSACCLAPPWRSCTPSRSARASPASASRVGQWDAGVSGFHWSVGCSGSHESVGCRGAACRYLSARPSPSFCVLGQRVASVCVAGLACRGQWVAGEQAAHPQAMVCLPSAATLPPLAHVGSKIACVPA